MLQMVFSFKSVSATQPVISIKVMNKKFETKSYRGLA